MKDQHHHQRVIFMQRAMDLALLGLGNVAPNPLVGCVIEVDGRIIGEGYHRRYGEAHAEVNAVNSVADKSLLTEATVYVNLEPCAHYGKTPPCADLLIEHQVKKVVISNVDSNPLVGGKGIAKLVSAGIVVESGVLENEGRELNKRFFTYIEKKRPYVILKWAETSDGFIARENFDSKWISGEESRQLVHRWRAEEPAILVGTNTALHDDPQLNVRNWSGNDPVRVVIDKNGTLPKSLKLFDGQQRTIVYTTREISSQKNLEFVTLRTDEFLKGLLADLYSKALQSVIVEGGASTLCHFINNGMWDEARVFTSSTTFGKGIPAPALNAKVVMETKIAGDTLKIYRND
ncbi:MAG TPA: bifunctional diaminohydroxyphosphoribosylaminopyrimidine deaminase/5-amino-6-(5-phosphoribosylamino)uracil reductase RibD [Chryseosolibacter sp.]